MLEMSLCVAATLPCGRTVTQVHARLAELELAAGGRPRFSEPGEYGLPEDTAGKAQEWAEKEGERARLMEGVAEFSKDPMGTLEAMK